MRKKEADPRKYHTTNRPNTFNHEFIDSSKERQSLPEDIREQLRIALEELEHHRLTSDLQVQKRVLLEQQLKTIKIQLEEQKQENDELRAELTKLSKKYSKAKEKKNCEKCKGNGQVSQKLQKEREIYLNDRKILQDQIKTLKMQLQNSQGSQQRQKLTMLVDSLRKQLYLLGKKMDQQTRVIQYMNDKLSLFEVQNVQIMNNVNLLQNKLSEMQIETVIRNKQANPCQNCQSKSRYRPEQTNSNGSHSLGKKRRNGSIQNIKKIEKQSGYIDQLERYEP